jgi:hypothetical protein
MTAAGFVAGACFDLLMLFRLLTEGPGWSLRPAIERHPRPA